jgi:hypothetical protein
VVWILPFVSLDSSIYLFDWFRLPGKKILITYLLYVIPFPLLYGPGTRTADMFGGRNLTYQTCATGT